MIVRGVPRGVARAGDLPRRRAACPRGARRHHRQRPAGDRATIDKFLASALPACAGVPTPGTVARERAEDALEASEELGGDVIAKPLFGSMGAGMTRVDDRDVAYRVFHALALERAVTTCRRRSRPIATCGRRRRGAGARGDRAGQLGLAGEPRARRPSTSHGPQRRAGAPVPGGGRGAGRRLRRRRPAGRACARAQRDPGLAWTAEGDGRGRGTGPRRARGGGRQRSAPARAAR